MNNPHVDALIYTVVHRDSVDYTSAEPPWRRATAVADSPPHFMHLPFFQMRIQ